LKSNTFNLYEAKLNVKSVILNEMQCSEESQIMVVKEILPSLNDKSQMVDFETVWIFAQQKGE
jgi:hypothetical protein